MSAEIDVATYVLHYNWFTIFCRVTMQHHHACYPAMRLSLAIAILLVASATRAFSTSDTTIHRRPLVLFIGHLNNDCFRDTVIGWADDRSHLLPHFIRWGKPNDRVSSDSTCRTATPLWKIPAFTEIRYPRWQSFTGSIAFKRFDADTLSDLLFILKGRAGDSANPIDTVRPIVLFAGNGLDTLPLVDLGSIGARQTIPCRAISLRQGYELVEPAIRDLTGGISYELPPMPPPLTSGKKPDSMAAKAPSAWQARIYPNPTGSMAHVEVPAVPPGEYSIMVSGIDGIEHLHRQATTSPEGLLLGTLDLQGLPSGYYQVKISSTHQTIGTWPLIITR